MTYLLDSDIISYLLKDRPEVAEGFREANARQDIFVLSVVVHYQLTRYMQLRATARMSRLYHALRSQWPVVGLSTADWDRAADLWTQRHRAGRPIEDVDLLIAVCALKSGATLVTNNTRHFEGLGVPLENWAA